MPTYLEELTTCQDGTEITVEEAVKKYGYRIVWIAALNSEIRDQQSRPRLHGYPPRVFISYRWDNDQTKDWVRQLASYLKERGLEVLLDQYQQAIQHHLDVPRYVSNIVNCHYCLIILTDGYCDVVIGLPNRPGEFADGWVRDEFDLTMQGYQSGLIKMIGILKEGDRLPAGFGFHNSLDLRQCQTDFSVLDNLFNHAGIVLSKVEQEELTSIILEFRNLSSLGQFEAALSMLQQHRKYQQTIEYKIMLCELLARVGKPKQAIQISKDIPLEQIDPEASLRLGYILRNCEEYRTALKVLLPLNKITFKCDHIHYLVGNILDDMGSYAGAINHLRFARNFAERDTDILNDLGMAYRHDRQLNKAIECFQHTIEINPQLELPLVNLIAALCEAGRIIEAKKWCHIGLELYPQNNSVLTLYLRLEEFTEDFVATARRHEEWGANYICHHCKASYYLDPNRQFVCGVCGSLGEKTHSVCVYCDSDKRVILDAESPIIPKVYTCPICRQGQIVRGI